MLPEQQQRIMGYFIEEAKDHLNTIEQGLINLQATIEDSEMVHEVFRAAHSVKGGAAMLGLTSIQHTAHRLEDYFKVLRECRSVRTTHKLETLFLRVFDTLQELIEQLQGPFGLTQDKAAELMAAVEPVFAELSHDLGLLVSQTGATLPEDVELVAPVAAAVPAKPQPIVGQEESAVQLIFQSDVPALLRQMLQVFKQPDSFASRQQLQNLCDRLFQPGEQLDLPYWCDLIEAAKRAIAREDNSYRALAPTVIRDVKQAQELVLAGRAIEIAPSDSLLDLLPPMIEENADQQDQAGFSFWDADEEIAATDGFAAALDQELAAPIAESAIAGQTASNQFDNDNLLFNPFPGIAAAEEEAFLLFDLDNADADLQESGLEVGDAELTSLADLFDDGFEEDAADSDLDWSDTFDESFNSPLSEMDTALELEDEAIESDANFSSNLLFNLEAEPSELDNSNLFTLRSEESPDSNPAADVSASLADLENELFGELAASSDRPPESAELPGQEPFDLTFEANPSSPSHPAAADLFDAVFGVDAETPIAANPFDADLPALEQESDSQFFDLFLLDTPDRESAEERDSSNAPANLEDLFTLEDLPETAEASTAAIPDFLRDAEIDRDNAESSESVSQTDALSDLFQPEEPLLFQLEELPLGGEVSTDFWSDADAGISLEQEAELDRSEMNAEAAIALSMGEAEAVNDNSPFSLFDADLELDNPAPDHFGEGEGFDDLEALLAESETLPAQWNSENSAAFEFDQPLEDENLAIDRDGTVTDRLLGFDSGSLADRTDSELVSSDFVERGAESNISESNISESGSAADEFADLEAMLDASAAELDSIAPAADSATDDFADLEALLSNSIQDVPPTAPPEIDLPTTSFPISDIPATGFPAEDEFGDLEALIKDVDQVLGVGSSPVRKATGANNRRSNRRNVLNEQLMRVSVKHLDNLNNLVGEMVVNRNSLEQAQERLRQFLDNLLHQVQQLSDVGQRMHDLYERSLLERSLLASRRGGYSVTGTGTAQTSHAIGVSFDALEIDQFTAFHTLSQEMIELIVRVRESASDIDFVVDESDQVTRNFRQITTQLQEGLTRSRMVPFAQTADRLPRGVRDNSLKYGKQAELTIEGRDTLIDKMIVDQLSDPMTHLVNNAIAHGIETPAERIAAGKSPTGRITVQAFHQGNQTIISVSDDGAGINPERVKAKALERGLITPAQARDLSRLEVYDLLFHHGFSTVDQVDDLRGRGVGLDVVRNNLNEIRGTITIDSAVGKGTTFTIRLPLTLSISKALCCISNRARIAFPMDGVEDMFDVPADRLQIDPEGRASVPWRDMVLPLQSLSELLRYSRVLGRGSVYGGNQEEDVVSIVVLRSGGNFLALQVDQVLGEQEIVIKQLEGPVPKPIGVAGATVLGDGRIMPIADVLELIDLWQGRIRREPGSNLWEREHEPIVEESVKAEPTVLIVDDSITVRELLSMTFSKVGYRVEQARDGQEAWEKLRAGLPCNLVFCDIEMPRMDGLELLSRIQKDPHLSELPIAMLTSRGADRHKQMAIQLGAKGYFTKPYLEEVLLDAAQRMLRGEVLVNSNPISTIN